MSGYLEEYGAGEESRESLIRNSILIGVAVVLLAAILIYLLRPIHQIRVTKHFLERVQAKDYPGAYAAWGCAAAGGCKEYTYPKFLEDWGPNSASATSPILKMTDAENCGNGVILTVDVSPGNTQRLFLDKGNDLLSYSPLPRCPGKSAWAIMFHRTLGRLRTVFF